MLASSFLFLIQASIVSLSGILSNNERSELLCARLREKAEELGLLLSEGEGPPGSICRLPWNEKVVIVNEDTIGLRAFNFDRYIKTDLVTTSTFGQMLILPPGSNLLSLTAHINKRRYTLVGGVAEFFNEADEFISCQTFTLDKDKGEVVFQALDHHESVQQNDLGCFSDSPLKRSGHVLPSITVFLDRNSVLLRYKYGIYRDGGSLEEPFDIQNLGLHLEDINHFDLREMPGIDFIPKHHVDQGVSLIRFIQLIRAIDPDHRFEDPDLTQIDDELQVLRGHETRQGTKDVLIKACNFLYHHPPVYPTTDPSWFIWSLKHHEPTMVDVPFFDQTSPFDPESKVEEQFSREDSSSKLILYSAQRPVGTVHQLLMIRHPNRSIIFKLIGAIVPGGSLLTFNVDHSHFQEEELFKMARYNSKTEVEVINSPIPGPQYSPSFPELSLLYIYYRDDLARFRKTKSAESNKYVQD